MIEYLDAYDINSKKVKTCEKKSLLKEIKEHSLKNGDAHLAVPVVYLLLSHPKKGVYVVKRANKSENPYLWCKPVGGHISSGENPDSTLIREAKEEIKTDIVVADSIDDYFDKLSEDPLTEHAVVRKIDFRPWFGTYRIDRDSRKRWFKRTRAYIYAGQFRGDSLGFTEATDNMDFNDGLGEAVAFKICNKKDLQEMLSSGDPRFTHDLVVLLRDYHAFV